MPERHVTADLRASLGAESRGPVHTLGLLAPAVQLHPTHVHCPPTSDGRFCWKQPCSRPSVPWPSLPMCTHPSASAVTALDPRDPCPAPGTPRAPTSRLPALGARTTAPCQAPHTVREPVVFCWGPDCATKPQMGRLTLSSQQHPGSRRGIGRLLWEGRRRRTAPWPATGCYRGAGTPRLPP